MNSEALSRRRSVSRERLGKLHFQSFLRACIPPGTKRIQIGPHHPRPPMKLATPSACTPSPRRGLQRVSRRHTMRALTPKVHLSLSLAAKYRLPNKGRDHERCAAGEESKGCDLIGAGTRGAKLLFAPRRLPSRLCGVVIDSDLSRNLRALLMSHAYTLHKDSPFDISHCCVGIETKCFVNCWHWRIPRGTQQSRVYRDFRAINFSFFYI